MLLVWRRNRLQRRRLQRHRPKYAKGQKDALAEGLLELAEHGVCVKETWIYDATSHHETWLRPGRRLPL